MSKLIFVLILLQYCWSQNSALSSHFRFGDNVEGDITISEVRVPANGLTFNTYYESLGFFGNKGNSTGNGYGGIQKSLDPRGDEIHIFSLWHANTDPSDTANFPYPVYLGHGTIWEYFGGEGVGLKTWNFELGWDPDVWYTHVVRTWEVGQHSYYAFFVRDGVSGYWRHLSTIGVREPKLRLTGANDAFIEDWAATGKDRREVHLRNNWRRASNGNWVFAQSGRYAPNSWDIELGRRSYNYRSNWTGGTSVDETGEYYS